MNNPTKVRIGEKEYKINTSFRTALKCNRIAQDENIGDYERALAVIYTLYGDEGLNDEENYDELLKLGKKYLACGKEIKTNEEPDMDYEQDHDLIVASFMSEYQTNPDEQDMHWWTFNMLMCGLSNSELGNCCVLNRVRNIRNYDTSQIKDKKTREQMIKLKKQFALKKKEPKLTKEQEESIKNINKLAGIS